MAVTIRSARLGGPTSFATAGGDLFTVPAGHRYLARSLKIVNNNAINAVSLALYIGTVTAAHEVGLITVPASSQTNLDPWRLTLEAGEALHCVANNASGLTVTCDGFDFTV